MTLSKTEQIIICLNGKLEVLCDDGVNKKKYLLESPQQALYIPPMIWDEQSYLSDNTVMLVLCNTNYDINDMGTSSFVSLTFDKSKKADSYEGSAKIESFIQSKNDSIINL